MTGARRARTLPAARKCRGRSRWVPWAISLTVLIATLASQGGQDAASGAIGLARVGSPAPDFTLTLLNGKSVTLSGFRGKPVLVNFWHSG